MNACARKVMEDFRELLLAYGQSDEYSFVFRKNTQLYSRRSFKLATNIASLFAAAYVMKWGEFFPETPLQYPPAFDARTVLYPTNRNLRDYLSWRQVRLQKNALGVAELLRFHSYVFIPCTVLLACLLFHGT